MLVLKNAYLQLVSVRGNVDIIKVVKLPNDGENKTVEEWVNCIISLLPKCNQIIHHVVSTHYLDFSNWMIKNIYEEYSYFCS